MADAIIRRQNRPGPQLIQDNPSFDASRSTGIVIDNDVEQPTLQPPTIEPQSASAGEMHVQHVNEFIFEYAWNRSFLFFVSVRDQLFGGESLCRRQSLIQQCCPPASIRRNPFGGNCGAQNKTKKLGQQICWYAHFTTRFLRRQIIFAGGSGGITVASQGGKKNPLSIYQLANAFLNFASVYLEVKSDETPHLLKYMSTVRQTHATNGDMPWRY